MMNWMMNWIKSLWEKLFGGPVRMCYPNFEFIEVSVNGQEIPPGNVSEIVFPNRGMNCFAMQGVFNGVWNIIYATGNVKIIAVPRGELERKEREAINRSGGNMLS